MKYSGFKKVLRLFLLIIIGVIIGLFPFFLVKKRDNKIKELSKVESVIKFEHDSVNVGRIFLQKKNIIFRFKNIGEKPLIVFQIKTSCGCTTTKWKKGIIKPGESGIIRIEFNPNHIGYFEKKVYVYANIKKNPVILKIFGKVVK